MNPSSRSLAATGIDTPPAPAGALAALSLSMLLSSLGTSIAGVGLPDLAQAFGAAFQDIQWIVLAYLLAITATVVGAGRLGDLLGRRRVLLTGLSVFTAASALCGLAPTLWLLIAARALQGLGGAVMMALTLASVGAAVPKARTGSAMGLLGTLSAVGTALGPALGGALLTGFGWRALFLVNVPLGLLALGLARRHLPPDDVARMASRTGFDVPGTVLLALTLTAYALAMTSGRGGFGALNLALLGLAAVGAGLFVRTERRAASPLVRLAMFRDPAFAASFATSAVVMTVMMATFVIGPFHLSGALGLDAAHVGFAMACGPVVSALAGVPAGRLVDRLGTSRMIVAGLAWMVAGCTLLALMPVRFGVAGYVAPLVVLTAGYALFQAANNTAVMAGAGAEQRGVVAGLVNLSRNLGLVTGASVMGAVFAFGAGTHDVASASIAAVAAGTHLAFGVAAMAVAGALAIVFACRAERRAT
jgi:MFS family permease